MTTHDGETTVCCAWCDTRLPAPIEVLPVIHDGAGEALVVCNEDCLADLVAVLDGCPRRDDRPGELGVGDLTDGRRG